MRIVPRRKLFQDVVPFPASKSVGELTLLGDELAPFEKNPGAVRVQLVAAGKSKITDKLTVKLNVSYDEGETWVKAKSFDDLKSGSEAVSVLESGLPTFAPMVRLDAVFDSSGALEEGHGCKVHAELSEGSLFRHTFFKDVVKIPPVISTKDIDAEKATTEVDFSKFEAGETITISYGETNETYTFGEEEDFSTLESFLTNLVENELVITAKSDGTITFTAVEKGAAGNNIFITITTEAEVTEKYQLEGGTDPIPGNEAVATGDKLFVETNNLKKVLVISTSDKKAGEEETFSYTLMSSYNGEDWWAVGEEEDIVEGIKEKEYSTKLGNYLRVDFEADDLDLEDHNARIHLVAYYA